MRRRPFLLFIVIAAVIVAVDATLGDTAECLNAWRLLAALSEPLHGRPPAGPYIVAQQDLGAWAPIVAAAGWLGGAAAIAALLLGALRLLRR